MIKMIGSKAKIIPEILKITGNLRFNSVLDLFSGTSRVGQEFKKQGKFVIANDHNEFAYKIAECYIGLNAEHDFVVEHVFGLINEYNNIIPYEGYFTDTFCKKALYFQPFNGMKIDSIRDSIAANHHGWLIESVLLVSLMEAADKVDNTCGLQMAYLKSWCNRSYNEIKLELPNLIKGIGRALKMDALECLKHYEADLIYMDPPYNQHSYAGNYHIWNTLCLWDKPEYYGIANKRIDCKEYNSPFNKKNEAVFEMVKCIEAAKCKYLLISFNDEGHISFDDMMIMCKGKGKVTVECIPNKRYIGSQIGQHNLEGDYVGTVTHINNHEYLFLVEC